MQETIVSQGERYMSVRYYGAEYALQEVWDIIKAWFAEHPFDGAGQ
jgi:hypothetical protein